MIPFRPVVLAMVFLLLAQAACKKKAPPKRPVSNPIPRPAQLRKAVESSTEKAKRPPTPEDYYKAMKLRDPFVSLQGGGGQRVVGEAVVPVESFNIHYLELKGILEDPGGKAALLVDPAAAVSYILKDGKVLDAKGEIVPGVTGKIQGQGVRLITSENDIQDLSLASEEEEEGGG